MLATPITIYGVLKCEACKDKSFANAEKLRQSTTQGVVARISNTHAAIRQKPHRIAGLNMPLAVLKLYQPLCPAQPGYSP